MSYRTRNIVLASGLAGLALIFMIIYASQDRGSGGGTAIAKGVVSVLFAAHNIPEGTPGSSLDNGAFVKKRVPTDAVVPGSITSPHQIAGTIATQETLAGEPVTTRRFGPVAAAGVLARIRGPQRVVQVAGDKTQTLDGTLNAGDHVDVYGTWNVPESCSTCHVSGAIVRDALVLATSAELGSGGAPGAVAETPVQLRLTNAEAERVLWMVKNGNWWLVLRPVVKPHNNRGYVTSGSILKSTLNQSGIIR